MTHPFPMTAPPGGPQPLPSFLIRDRNSLEQIRKDPFKLTRRRSKLKPVKKEERIDSAKTVSLDISKCLGFHDIFRQLCLDLGWKLWTKPRQLGLSDIYWHAQQTENFSPFIGGGAINRVPCMSTILKKINLTRALNNLAIIFPDEFNFHPKTWFLPQQFHEFCADVAYDKRTKRKKKSPAFIVKPDAGTQGERNLKICFIFTKPVSALKLCIRVHTEIPACTADLI